MVRSIRLCPIGVLAALVVLGGAAQSMAGVKTIWPHQLKPYYATDSAFTNMAEAAAAARHGFFWVGAESEGVTYAAPVRLKPGTRVTGFSAHVYSAGSATVRATLWRSKVDGTVEKVAEIERVNSSYIPQWLTADSIDISRVQGGYTYWVRLYISNGAAIVHGLRIAYR